MAALKLPGTLPSTPLEQLIAAANTDEPTAASLKLVKTIVKNLVDHAGEEKYMSIKLSGKAGQKLTAAPSSVAYLTSLGFATSEDGATLAIESANALVAGTASATPAAHIVTANQNLSQVAVPGSAPAAAAAARPVLAQTTAGNSSSAGADPFAGMSLKQKARRQKELDEAKKREAAKRLKAEELEKIKQDAYVRKNDENWKAAAAGVKGGKDIDTFRGKNGEDGC